MYKKIVRAIIEAKSYEDMNTVFGMIDKAFEWEKISWKDHEELYELASKFYKK